MTLIPIIARELRIQARLTSTYWLRVLGVGSLLLTALYFAKSEGLGPNLGGRLFSYLNFTMFCSIWILVPLFTADCLSREKREGTLGLLFLTPLKARHIVLAKVLAQALRALVLWLVVLPVLTIPFLLGGVSWKEAAMSVLINFSCICWALAAGLLASSVCRVWLRSLLCAGILSATFLLSFLFASGVGLLLMLWTLNNPSSSIFNLIGNNPDEFFRETFNMVTGYQGYWGAIFQGASPLIIRQLLKLEAIIAAFSILLLFAAILLAAIGVRRGWRDRPVSRLQLWFNRRMCTPVIGVSFFRRWMRHKLEHNPIGWLEQRTWTGRMVTWGWFAVMISLYSLAFRDTGFHRAFEALQHFLALLLIGSLAVAAAGSFRRERETGLLELLLVSPTTESQIIGGRLRGLWGQFLPALLVLVAIWIYFHHAFQTQGNLQDVKFYSVSFLTVPVIGLYFSLRRSNFMSAFLFTIAVGLLLPIGLQQLIATFIESMFPDSFPSVSYPNGAIFAAYSDAEPTLFLAVIRLLVSPNMILVFQCLFAALLGRSLYRDLAKRNFEFTRAMT